MTEENKNTLIVGDFNVCIKKNPKNKLSETLEENGFKQLMEEATHILGGHLDHVYFRSSGNQHLDLERYSPFYSDHDATCITIQESPDEKQVMLS